MHFCKHFLSSFDTYMLSQDSKAVFSLATCNHNSPSSGSSSELLFCSQSHCESVWLNLLGVLLSFQNHPSSFPRSSSPWPVNRANSAILNTFQFSNWTMRNEGAKHLERLVFFSLPKPVQCKLHPAADSKDLILFFSISIFVHICFVFFAHVFCLPK